MIEDHETIVSQGRDAGVPHSRGDRAAPLVASSPLGLYYPHRGIGVRIEDTFWVGENGRAVSFCTMDRGLVP